MIVIISLGMLVGAIILTGCSKLPSLNVFVFLGALPISLISLRLWQHKKQPTLFLKPSLFCLSVMLGFSWAYLQAHHRLAWHLTPEITNTKTVLEGTVVGEVVAQAKQMKFVVRLKSINGFDIPISYKSKILCTWNQVDEKIQPGSHLQFSARLRPFHSLYNPGTWDEEKYAFVQGIRAKAKVLSSPEILSQARWNFDKLRQGLADQLKAQFSNNPYLPVITALTLGIRSDLDSNLKTVFQNTGTSHLLAISGLHLGLVATFCFFCARRMARFFPTGLLYVSAPQFAAGITLLVSFLYACLAGFSLPTQRALIMISVAMMGIVFKKRVFAWKPFFIALLLVVLYDPLSPLQAGFWLSFLAVGALLLGRDHLPRSGFKKWWMPQCVVFVALLPLGVCFFQQIAWSSPIANFFAIPIVAGLVVPVSLLGVCLLVLSQTLAFGLIQIALTVFSVVYQGLLWLNHWPGAAFWHAQPVLGVIFMAMMGAVIFILPRAVPGRSLAALAFLPLFFIHPIVPGQTARISVLEVGQGLSVLIETRHHALLYDAGPQFSARANAGDRIILPYLQQRGISKLDKVVISHVDLDHRGGLKAFTRFPIEEILSSEPDALSFKHPFAKLRACHLGQQWSWDGVDFEMLHPEGNETQRNDRSCVLKVTAQGQSVLLTGDLTTHVEQKLVRKIPEKLLSDILLVPHHGSRTSSSLDFIHTIGPKYALYSVGLFNSYNLPNKEVIERYEKAGAINLISPQTGMMIFELGQEKDLTPPRLWRETAKHLWHEEIKTC